MTAGATISDVAQAAGVSRATVSRVMNGRKVDPELARRVQVVAERLHYRPSLTARSLSLGRTLAVGLVVPDLTNPMFQAVLRGVADGADADGYAVVVAETAQQAAREIEIARTTRARCDALVLVSPSVPDKELAEAATQLGPLVMVNRTLPELSIPAVSVDFAEAMYSAVEHLTSLGHESIVYLAGPSSSPSNAARIAGLDRAQVSFRSVSFIVLPCGNSIAEGHAAAEHVLSTRASAVIAYNDLVAFGLLARLSECGVSVPEDVSVVGFDDIELAGYATPPLTTVAVPHAELGVRAWQKLRARIEGADPSQAGQATATTDVLATRLVIRASTGPAPILRANATPAAPTVGLDGPPVWYADGEDQVLGIGAVRLARYRDGRQMPEIHSPRPHLHPVRSSSGVRLSAESPIDRRHHYGVSLALPDVNGTNFWGARTFVTGEGLTLLDDHGRQTSRGTSTDSSGTLAVLHDSVDWTAPDGTGLVAEDRTIEGAVLPGRSGWAMRWQSTLRALTPLRIASPVQAGRTEVGYGGVFWRFATADEVTVATADGVGQAHAYGSHSPWLSLAIRKDASWTTVVLIQPGTDPWFVRTDVYVGAGPSIAWDRAVDVPAGSVLEVGLIALVLEGLHTPSAVAERWHPAAADLFPA